LTEQARQLIKTGWQVDLNTAAARLTEALALDPDNRDAQTLSLIIPPGPR
jgi:predicted TIM-barrel fold metal-dependent hydrolase